MPKNLLLEAGFLCLPDNLFASGMPDLRTPLAEALRREKFEFSRLRCWISQHRIGILVEGLADGQTEITKEVRGPKASGAYDYNNQPSLAAKGFAAAQGLEFKDLITREIDGEKFLFAVKSCAGNSLEKCLASINRSLFAALPVTLPPSKNGSLLQQPPVYFACLLDDHVPDIELEGVKAGRDIGFRDGLGLKYLELRNAGDYPQIMNQIGLIGEPNERRKTFEARIRSVLPEGYLLRADHVRTSKVCFYSEGMQPMLLKFDPAYLDIPEAVLHRYLLFNNGYLACEDARGRIMPAAVAVSEHARPSAGEIALRTAALEHQLRSLLNQWQKDKEALPERITQIAEKFADGKSCLAEPGDSLARIAVWLSARLLDDKDMLTVATILALVAEGEKTELARLMPETGFAVVVNCLGQNQALVPLQKHFNEICSFFASRIPAPQTRVAQVICLAIMMRSHAEPQGGQQSSIERIVTLLRAALIKVDIFQAFSDVFPDFSLDRHAWIENCAANALTDKQYSLLHDSFHYSLEFDPVSFFEAARDWKEASSKDAEVLNSLLNRLRGKVEAMVFVNAEFGECSLESELNQQLGEIERAAGVPYGEIIAFFNSQRVNIEACMINLPPVLDDRNAEHQPRIKLIQRIIRQLGRLPFICREKVAAKK